MISLPVAYLLVFVCFLVLFRKFFAPKLEGKNVLTEAWSWPWFGNMHWFLTQNPSRTIMGKGKNYGDVFLTRMGCKTVLVVNGVKACKEACTHRPLNGRPNCEFKTLANNKGYLFADSNEKFRDFIIPYLKQASLNKTFEEKLINVEVQACISHIGKNEGKPVDIKNIFSIPTLNVIFQLVLGERFKMDDPIFLNIIDTINLLSALPNPLTRAAIFLPWLTKYDPGFLGARLPHHLIGEARDVCEEHFNSHQERRSQSEPRDMTDAYIDKFGDTKYYSEIAREEKSEWTLIMEELFIGGVETTGGVLEWLIAYLAHYPQIQRKFQQEIDLILTDPPTLADRENMPYVQAVIEEVLRIRPILGFGYHGAREKTTFKHSKISKGTFVLINFYSANHDPDHWANPDTFQPQRFINPSGKFQKSPQMLTFGYGRRSCPGEIWARDQIFLFSVSLLKNYNILPYGKFPGFSFGILTRAKPFQLIFQKRSNQNIRALA